jgi:hypothetical protein
MSWPSRRPEGGPDAEDAAAPHGGVRARSEARVRGAAQRRRCTSRLTLFDRPELEIFKLNSKIFEYQSCRASIGENFS